MNPKYKKRLIDDLDENEKEYIAIFSPKLYILKNKKILISI
jgi:hypothetical protein